METIDSELVGVDVQEAHIGVLKRKYLTVIKQKKSFLNEWHADSNSRLIYIDRGIGYLQSAHCSSLVTVKHAIWVPGGKEIKLETSSLEASFYILCFDESYGGKLRDTEVFPVPNLGQELILKLDDWVRVSSDLTELERASLQVIRLLIPQWSDASVPLLLPSSDHPKLGVALSYVRENAHSRIGLNEVADVCAISKRTLTRLFQQELGISFSSYLRLVRITLALEMFNESGASVSRVAFDVGYESITAFSNTFRLFVGVRPQKYLKKLSR